MAKEKITLSDLKVQSSVTSLNNEQLGQVKGGHYTIRGRRFNHIVRWTAVDTRTQTDESTSTPGQG
jgi:hypothetical protein